MVFVFRFARTRLLRGTRTRRWGGSCPYVGRRHHQNRFNVRSAISLSRQLQLVLKIFPGSENIARAIDTRVRPACRYCVTEQTGARRAKFSAPSTGAPDFSAIGFVAGPCRLSPRQPSHRFGTRAAQRGGPRPPPNTTTGVVSGRATYNCPKQRFPAGTLGRVARPP